MVAAFFHLKKWYNKKGGKIIKAKKFPIEVGQKVWLWPTGNNVRHSGCEDISTGIISKIGRKYFYVSKYAGDKYAERFEVETFESSNAQDCNAGYIIFASEQAIMEYQERRIKIDKVRRVMTSTYNVGFSLEETRELYDVLVKYGHIDPEGSV